VYKMNSSGPIQSLTFYLAVIFKMFNIPNTGDESINFLTRSDREEQHTHYSPNLLLKYLSNLCLNLFTLLALITNSGKLFPKLYFKMSLFTHLPFPSIISMSFLLFLSLCPEKRNSIYPLDFLQYAEYLQHISPIFYVFLCYEHKKFNLSL